MAAIDGDWMKRVKFGIHGLDEALCSGLERGSASLISGGPGTGKTSIGLQFVYHGAKEGETTMYVSLEEQKQKLLQSASTLGMKDFEKLVKGEKILLMGMENFNSDELRGRIAEEIYKTTKGKKVKRIVVDTLTTLSIYAISPRWKLAATQPAPKLVLFQPSKANVKQFVFNFISMINRIDDATMLFLSEANDEHTAAQEYVVDSVIQMDRSAADGTLGGEVLLRVIKTRRSPHSSAVHVVRVNGIKGVEVMKASEALK